MGRLLNKHIQVEEYYYDVAVDGGAIGVYDLSAKANQAVLPEGALLLDIRAVVLEAFASAGAATLSIGDTANDARVMGPTAVGGLLLDVPFSVSPEFVVRAANNTVDSIATVAGADFTAGKMVVYAMFLLNAGNE